jgi:hypothetical protein
MNGPTNEADSIRFQCPVCNQEGTVPASAMGHQVRCSCGAVETLSPQSGLPRALPRSGPPRTLARHKPAQEQARATPVQPAGSARFSGAKVWEQAPVLLDQLGRKADELMGIICRAFTSREIPGSNIGLYAIRIRLRRRNYLIASWGRCRAYIYVTGLGKDLYASWVGYYKLRISLLKILLFPVVLLVAVRYGLTIASFYKPPNEFEQEDISKFAAAIDHWARYSIDRFLEKAGWDETLRQKRFATAGVSFAPMFKKA